MIYLSDAEIAEIPKRISGQQSFFLRKLREHPHNLPLKYWPRPTTWRRWQRQRGFVRAVRSIIESCESQTQLLMAGAAHQAALLIQATLTGGDVPSSGMGMTPSEIKLYEKSLKPLLGVLWLHMARLDQQQRQATMQQTLAALTTPPVDDETSAEGETLGENELLVDDEPSSVTELPADDEMFADDGPPGGDELSPGANVPAAAPLGAG